MMIKSVLRKMNAYNIVSYLRRGYFIFPSGMFEKRIGELLIAKKNTSSSRDKDTCDKCKRLIEYTFGHGKFPIGDIKGMEHINFDNEECLSKLDKELIKTIETKSNCCREDCTEEKCQKLIDQIFENEREIIQKGTEKENVLENSNIVYHQDGDDTGKENVLKVTTFRPTWPPRNSSTTGHGYRGLNKDPGNNKKHKDKRNHIRHVIVTTATTPKTDVPSISIDYRVMLEPYIDIYDDKDEDIATVVVNKNVSIEKYKQTTISESTKKNLEHELSEPEKIRVDLTLYSDAICTEEKNEKAQERAKQKEKPERLGIPISSLRQNSVISFTNHSLNIGTQQIDPFQVKKEMQNVKRVPEPIIEETKKLECNKFDVSKNWQDIANCHQEQNAMLLDRLKEESIKFEKMRSAMIIDNLKAAEGKPETVMRPDIFEEKSNEENETESKMKPDSSVEKPIKHVEPETVMRPDFLNEEPEKDKIESMIRTDSSRQESKTETAMRPDPLMKELKTEGEESTVRTDSSREESIKYVKPKTVINQDTSEEPVKRETTESAVRSDSFTERSQKENLDLEFGNDPLEEPTKKEKTEYMKDDHWKDFERIAVPVAMHESSMPNLTNYGIKLKVPKVDTMDPLQRTLKREKKINSKKPIPFSKKVKKHETDTNETMKNEKSESISKPREVHSKALLTGNEKENNSDNDAPKLKTAQLRQRRGTHEELEHSPENFTVLNYQVKQGSGNPNKLMNGSFGDLPSENKFEGEKEISANNETAHEKIGSEFKSSLLTKSEKPVLQTEEIHPLFRNEHVLEEVLVSDYRALAPNTDILLTNTEDLNPYTFPTESQLIKLIVDKKEHAESVPMAIETKSEIVTEKKEKSTQNIDDTRTINDINEKRDYKDIEQESFTPDCKPDYKPEAYTTTFTKPTNEHYSTCYINYVPQCCHYVQSTNTYQQSYQRYFLGLAEHYRHIQQRKCYDKFLASETGEELNAKSAGQCNVNSRGESDTKSVQVLDGKPGQVLNAEITVGLDAKSMIDIQPNISQVQPNPDSDSQSTIDTRPNVSFLQPGKILGRGSRTRAETLLKRRLPVETSAQRQVRNRRRTKHDHVSIYRPRNSLENEVPLSVLLEKAREKNRMEYCHLYDRLQEQEKMYQQLKQKQQTTSKRSRRDKSPPSYPPPSPTCPPPEVPRSSPPMSFPPMGRSPKFCPPKKDAYKFFDAFATLSVYDNDNPNERSAKASKRREFEKRLLGKKGLNHWIFVQGRPRPLCDAENLLECSKDTCEENFILI